MRRVVLIVAAIFVFTEALAIGVRADQQVPQGQGGAPAPARQGGQGQAGQGQAGQGRQGGGSNVQDVVGGVNQQQGGAQGRGGAGGRGRAAGPPPKPAPRDANGRAILWGFTPQEKGV